VAFLEGMEESRGAHLIGGCSLTQRTIQTNCVGISQAGVGNVATCRGWICNPCTSARGFLVCTRPESPIKWDLEQTAVDTVDTFSGLAASLSDGGEHACHLHQLLAQD